MPTDSATTLLERERELTALADALSDADERRGRVVLIEAPAGLGKTSLLRAASESAGERGFSCLRARASDLERDFAYGCVRQLLEPAVAQLSGTERESVFAGTAATSKCLFVPSAPLPPDEPAGAEGAASDLTFSMLHGLYWLVNNLAADEPLALVVDDLHWADPETLRFLVYLAPRLDGLAVALLATTRPGEGDADELARLSAAPETNVVRPSPLSIEATAMLCERALGDGIAPAFAEACGEATGGNPFFLEALLREVRELGFPSDASGARRVRELGPAAVAQAVLLPLSGRPESATQLVRAAAILGDGPGLAEAAALAELPEDEAAGAADLLVALGILTPADSLQFAHPIVRESVYADIGPRERARAHARAARLLAANGASDERIAAQIAESEPAGDQKRVELLRKVAADALMRGAPAAAATLLRRALAEPPAPEVRPDVLVELGSAELRRGSPDAIGHLSEAVGSIEETAALAAAARQLANALTITGRADRGVEALEAAIDVVEPEDLELALLLEAELASVAWQASLETRAPAARRLQRRGNLEGSTPGERLVLASLACEQARSSESATEATALLEGRARGRPPARRAAARHRRPLLRPGARADRGRRVRRRGGQPRAGSRQRTHARVDPVGGVPDRPPRLDVPPARCRRQGRGRCPHRSRAAQLACHSARHSVRGGGPHRSAYRGRRPRRRGAGPARLRQPGRHRTWPDYELHAALAGASALSQGRTEEGIDDMLEFGRRDELWGGAKPTRLPLALPRRGRVHRTRREREGTRTRRRGRRAGAPLGAARRHRRGAAHARACGGRA